MRTFFVRQEKVFEVFISNIPNIVYKKGCIYHLNPTFTNFICDRDSECPILLQQFYRQKKEEFDVKGH